MNEFNPLIAHHLVHEFLHSNELKFSETTIQEISKWTKVVAFPKKHILIKEGGYCDFIYYIIQGASRSYYIQNSTEIHTWFAFENDVIGSLRNFNNLASNETIELLEDSILLSFPIQKLQEGRKNNLEIAHFVHEAIVEHALFLEDRIFDVHMKSASDKFKALLHREPEIFQRVSLTYIASYLGISRETLSRLRAQ